MVHYYANYGDFVFYYDENDNLRVFRPTKQQKKQYNEQKKEKNKKISK
jgi:hypothetical protein